MRKPHLAISLALGDTSRETSDWETSLALDARDIARVARLLSASSGDKYPVDVLALDGPAVAAPDGNAVDSAYCGNWAMPGDTYVV